MQRVLLLREQHAEFFQQMFGALKVSPRLLNVWTRRSVAEMFGENIVARRCCCCRYAGRPVMEMRHPGGGVCCVPYASPTPETPGEARSEPQTSSNVEVPN